MSGPGASGPDRVAQSTQCRVDAALGAAGRRLICLAATSGSATPAGERFAIGYEFVGVADTRRGTYVFCRTTPRAGEKFGGAALAEVPLDPACVDPRRRARDPVPVAGG
jgi:hypothetical protein